MGMGLGQLGGLGRLGRPRLEGVGAPSLAQLLFGNGEDGFLFGNFAELDELFTTVNGPNVASDSDPVGLALDDSKWSGRTPAQELAQQTELFSGGDIPNTTGWTGSNATLTAEANGLKVLSTTVGASARTGYKQFDDLTIGRWYYTGLDVTEVGGTTSGSILIRFQVTTLAGSSIQDSLSVTGTGERFAYFQATATSHRIQPRFDGSGADTTTYAIFDNISVKAVPVNHGLATGTQRAFWQSNSGNPYLAFDGSDDRLLTPFLPTASMGYAAAVRCPASLAGTQYILGSGATTGTARATIGFNTSGHLVISWGGTTATASAVDYRGLDLAVIIWSDGSNLWVYVNGTQVYTGAFSGTLVNTIAPVTVGGLRFDTSYFNFFGGRMYAVLAVDRALTLTEVARINTDLQGTYQ